MTGALFSRVKTWGTTDTLTAVDLNAEFDNILTNFIPTMMQGYSASVAQMQTQTSPGTVGSESLAAALSGELERLRYIIAQITGNTYWYTLPGASISQLVTALGTSTLNNKVSSGVSNSIAGSAQPIYVQPSGSVASVTVVATGTTFNYTINGSSYTLTANVTVTSLTTAPSTGNTVTVNDSTADNSSRSKLLGENGSVINIQSAGASVTPLQGSIVAFKTASATAEYFIGRLNSTSTAITQVFRGYFFNSANALMGRQTINNGDVLTVMKLTWLYASTTGTVTPVYTNPRVSGSTPGSPATGDYWFDTSVNYWKTYTGVAWTAANATFIGVTIQNTTACVGARSQDFYEAFSPLNSAELFVEGNSDVRTRYTGAQVNVYGTTQQYLSDYIRWNATGNVDSGETVTASNYYYMYVNTQGTALISSIAPYDRRGDLQGYYHPANTYRCLGFVYVNASTNFQEVESFYRSDTSSAVSTLTNAVSNFPLPFGINFNEQTIVLDGTNTAFTQALPHPTPWKGKDITYVKKDSTYNVITLQGLGSVVLSTTGNTTTGSAVITNLAATTGLTAGMYVMGPGMVPSNTITGISATSATIGTAANLVNTGGTYIFSKSDNALINGYFQTTLNTQNEAVTVRSDGTNWWITNRRIPSYWISDGGVTLTAVTTAPTKGIITNDQVFWRRVGDSMEVRIEYHHTAAGAPGSGDYLFTAPAGRTIDTSKCTANTSATSFDMRSTVGGGQAVGQASMATVICTVYDSTHVRLFGFDAVSYYNIGSGNYALSGTACSYLLSMILPISGWNA